MILFLKSRTPGDDRTMDLFGEPAGSVTASTTRVKGHVRSDGTFVREHMRHVKRARPQVPSPRPIPRGEPGPGQVTMPLAAAPTPVPDAPMSDDEVWAWVQKVVPEEQQFEVLDRFADLNGTNQMHLLMAWRDVRRDGLQARRERARADFLAHHGPDPVGLEARNPKTDQHAVILPDASAPGRFRASLFDARGFYSHSTRDTPEQILEELIDDGFTEHAPGALDRLASTPEWAEGMEHAWGIQRSNAAPVKQEAPKPKPVAKRLTYDEAVRRNMEYMGTKPEDWSAVPVSGMAESEDDRGSPVAMPTFEFPAGYTQAPTMFSNSGFGDTHCELCGTPIKNLYWLKHDKNKWLMCVGSECVTHYNDGESGERLAKRTVRETNRAFLKDVETTKNVVIAGAKTFLGPRQDMRDGVLDTLRLKLIRALGKMSSEKSSDGAVTRWIGTQQETATELVRQANTLAESIIQERTTPSKSLDEAIAEVRGRLAAEKARGNWGILSVDDVLRRYAVYAKDGNHFVTSYASQMEVLPRFGWTRLGLASEMDPPKPPALPETIRVDGVDRPTRNSEGRVIHPTEEGVRNFWRWFGESNVVDGEGKPLVVYHGGGAEFSKINRGRFGEVIFVKEGSPAQYGTTTYPLYLRGSVLELDELSDLLSERIGYAVLAKHLPDAPLEMLDEVAAALTDGSHYPDDEAIWEAIGAIDESDAQLEIQVLRGKVAKDLGFSAVRTPDEFDSETLMVVDAQAIKSAIGNSGAFSPANPEITKAMTPLILFFKAQKRGTQGRVTDLFGANPPLMDAIVPVKGTIDKDGHLRKPHMRRVKVRPEEHATKIALAPLTDSAVGSTFNSERDGDGPAPSAGGDLMDAYPDPRGLDKPETYENPELATLARRLAEAEYARLPPGTISRGDLKREFLAGKHADKVGAALDAKEAEQAAQATKATKAKEDAAAIVAPPGYSVEVSGDIITVKGPFEQGLHDGIKRAGGHWNSPGRNWKLPAEKGSTLKRIMANLAKRYDPTAEEAARLKHARSELERWLGYVEEKAPTGYLYMNGVNKLRELGIGDHPDLKARLDAAIAKVDEVKAAQERRRATAASLRAYDRATEAPEAKARVLYPVSSSPILNEPRRLGDQVVVFTGFGQPFRINEDHPSAHGSHLLGHEGKRGHYAYYRPATEQEKAAYLVQEAEARAKQEATTKRKAALGALVDHFRKHGERPVGGKQMMVEGERLLDTATIYGGGSWWVIQPNEAIWYVQNNGSDGDDWSVNNVYTGGAGAVGWRMPFNPEVAEQLRAIDRGEAVEPKVLFLRPAEAEAPAPSPVQPATSASSDVVYQDGAYKISRHGPDLLLLTNGAKSEVFRLHRPEDLYPQQVSMLRRANANPADYARVENTIIRRAAMPGIEAAYAAMLEERKAKSAAKAMADAETIARDGKRALILHGSGLVNSSLAYVTPDGHRMKPVGDWSAIDRKVVSDFLSQNGQGRERFDAGMMGESSVVLLTDQEWDSLMTANRASSAMRAEAKRSAQAKVEADREAARAQAASTGSPVEIDRKLVNSESEDGMVAIITMIRGDGSTFTKQQILG